MDINDFIAKQEMSAARLGYTQALLDPETPEQAAERFRKSRAFDIPASIVGGMTPEQEATERARSVNWAAMHEMAPVLTERLSEPAFANLVKNDLNGISTFESLIWRMSKVVGTPKTIWETFRNAISGGSFQSQVPLAGAAATNEALREELERVGKLENLINQGKLDEARSSFETAEDPTGEVGLQGFIADLPRIKKTIVDRMAVESENIARSAQYAMLFPSPQVSQDFAEAKTFGEIMKVIAQNPGMLITDIGTRSAMQMAPSVLLAAPLGNFGIIPQMAGTFLTSAYIDKQAALIDNIVKNMGVDPTKADQVLAAFADPAKGQAFLEQVNKAKLHGVGTGAWESLGVFTAAKTFFGLVGKEGLTGGLLPKSISRASLDTAYKQRFAELAAQSTAQAAFGAAGEATGQLMSDKEITSLSDIVAEAIGGTFSAPFEVYTAGMSARAQLQAELNAAKAKAENAAQLADLQGKTQAEQLDPATVADHFDQIATRAQVGTVSIDAESFHQAGLDKKFAEVPAVAEQLSKALAEGGTIDVPLSVATQMIAQDESKQLLGMIAIGDTESFMQTEEKLSEADKAAKRLEKEAAEKARKAYNAEVAEVGRIVGGQLRALAITAAEARGIQAIIQSNVAAVAQQIGMSPMAYWEKYGATYLGEPNVKRGVNDNEVYITMPAGADKKPTQSMHKGDTAFSSETSDKKPKGQYFPSLRVIARWNTANPTTLLHETGHLFLDARMRAAADLLASLKASGAQMTKAQKEFLENVKTVLDWFGIESVEKWNSLTVEQQRKYHEKFARSFEAYVMENEAPTDKLREVFRKFKRWLKTAYTIVANIPDAEVSESVRDMFDTFFLSSEQVREAAIRNNEPAPFEDIDSMTDEEREEYEKAKDALILEAEEDLNTRNEKLRERVQRMRDRTVRSLRKQRRETFDRIRKEIAEDFKKTKTYKAWNLLKNGISEDGKIVTVKLFHGDLKAAGYSDSQINALRKESLTSSVASKQPIALDDLAQQLGYANGKELVDDMLECRDAEKYMDKLTADRINAEEPQLASKEAMKEAADAAIFNNAKQKMVEIELAALEKTDRKVSKARAKAIDAVAYNDVMQMSRDPKKSKRVTWAADFARKANNAARNFRRAWAKGAIADAIRFKRQELYWTAKANYARKFAEESQKFRDSIPKYRKIPHPGIAPRFLELIQRAITFMGMDTEERMKLNPTTESFSTILEAFEKELGIALPVDPKVVDALNSRDPNRLASYEDFFAFVDFIKTVEAAGRKEMHITTIKGREDAAKTRQNAAASVRKVADEHNRPVKVEMEERGRAAEFKDFLVRFGLSHARAAALVAVLDGDWRGALTELMIYPSDKAATEEAQLRNRFTKKLDGIFKPIQKDLASLKKKTSAVFNHAFDTQQVFVALLNYGNEGNRVRLLATMKMLTGKDFFEGVDVNDPVAVAKANKAADDAMADFFNEYLTEEHFKAAQEIWDVFEEIRVLSDQTARKIMGRSPVWITPRKVKIGPNRYLNGGFYTIVYDRKMSIQGGNLGAITDAQSMKPVLSTAGVSDGHLKARVNVFDKGLVLTTRALSEGLDAHIHYIAWAEFINTMRKLLTQRGELAQAIKERYGTEYYMSLTRWVQDCSNGNTGQNSPLDALPNLLRRNVSLAGVGFNLQTAALQIVGVVQSITYLGGRWAAVGAGEYLRRGPIAARDYVYGKSEMMKDRMRTQFREIAEIQAQLSGTELPGKEAIMRGAFIPLSIMQMAVDVPTWLGAYQKAIYEGRDETAIAEADRAVMNAQGSGRPSDLSAMERGNAWAKLFTVFYTFFNTALNLAMVSGQTKKGMKAAIDICMLLMIQPVIESFLKSGAEEMFGSGDDDEDWIKKAMADAATNTFKFNLGLFVGLREMQWVFDDYGYSGPSGLRKVTDTGRAIKAWERGITKGEWDEQTARATMSALGVWVGLPITPVNRLISGTSALANDKTDNWLVLLNGYSDKN